MSFGASMTILPKRLVLVLRVQLGLRKMEGDETEWLAISKCYQYPKEPHPWSEYKAGIHTWANGCFPKLKTILGAYLARAACSNFVATIPFQGHRNLANRRKDQYASDG